MTHGRCALLFFLLEPSPSLSLSLALASNSSGEGSRSTSTNRLPSGDHSKSSTSWTVSVNRCASPPDRLSKYTWLFPSFPSPSGRDEVNARYWPSGDHRGCSDDMPSAVSAIGSPTAAGTIQIRVSDLSSFKEVDRTV